MEGELGLHKLLAMGLKGIKAARPLRGGSGAVTEEAREKEVRRRGPLEEGRTNRELFQFLGAGAPVHPFHMTKLKT